MIQFEARHKIVFVFDKDSLTQVFLEGYFDEKMCPEMEAALTALSDANENILLSAYDRNVKVIDLGSVWEVYPKIAYTCRTNLTKREALQAIDEVMDAFILAFAKYLSFVKNPYKVYTQYGVHIDERLVIATAANVAMNAGNVEAA